MKIQYDRTEDWDDCGNDCSSGDESTTHYVNYRIENNKVPITPIVASWLANASTYHITYWTTTYSANYVIEHGFIFVETISHPMDTFDTTTTHSLLLSDQNVGVIDTSRTLLNSKNGHVVKGVKPTKETCGPALQVILKGGYKRWLFPHPDGQRAAWEHLCNTTTEDDRDRLAEIGMNIIENHKSL